MAPGGGLRAQPTSETQGGPGDWTSRLWLKGTSQAAPMEED